MNPPDYKCRLGDNDKIAVENIAIFFIESNNDSFSVKEHIYTMVVLPRHLKSSDLLSFSANNSAQAISGQFNNPVWLGLVYEMTENNKLYS